jgi:hypothetical protein
MNNLSYAQMGHISHEGMFLDQRVPTEKFKYDMKQINWLDDKTKNFLIDMIIGNVSLYGNLNPYAVAVGYLAVENNDGNLVITKNSLKEANKILSKHTNYDGIKLNELIEITDVIRYARLYIKIKEQSGNIDKPFIDSGIEYDDDDENYNNVYDEEYHDEYDNFDYQNELEDEYD